MDLQRCTFFLDQGLLQRELIDRSVGLAGWVGGLVHLYSSNFYTFEGKSAKW